MKRFTYLFLCLALILSLSVPVLALSVPEEVEPSAPEDVQSPATLSEDMQTLNWQGTAYVRFNDTRLQGYYVDYGTTLELTEEQQKHIEKTTLTMQPSTIAIKVNLQYIDGANMTMTFIREDMYEPYAALLNADTVLIQFSYPERTQVELKLNIDTMEQEILFEDDYYSSNTFKAVAEDAGMSVSAGMMLALDDTYYYVDYEECQKIYNGDDEALRIKAWVISDEDTCAKLDEALDAYYGGLGIFEDDNFSEAVSKVFLIATFVVLPTMVLILFVVLAIIAKTPVYKKLFWNICAWAGVLLIFVGIIAAMVKFF